MCLLGIFDRINVRALPTVHVQAALVIQYEGRTNGVSTRRVEIRPSGAVLMKLDGEAIVGPNGGAGLSLRLQGVQIPDAGYAVNIHVNDHLSFTGRFDVGQPVASGLN